MRKAAQERAKRIDADRSGGAKNENVQTSHRSKRTQMGEPALSTTLSGFQSPPPSQLSLTNRQSRNARTIDTSIDCARSNPMLIMPASLASEFNWKELRRPRSSALRKETSCRNPMAHRLQERRRPRRGCAP